MNDKQTLDILFRISRAMVGKQDLDEILQQIVQMTADVAGFKICSLMLLDQDKQELMIKATQSLSAVYRSKAPIKVGESISGRVVQQKIPMQIEDVTKDEHYLFADIAKQEGITSLLSVPMMIEGNVIGVLNCYLAEARSFANEEIQLVQTIANQAAIAVEHVRVIQSEAKARHQLETKKVMDKAKRLLIKERQMSEEEAHRYIQKMSMRTGKPLFEVSQALLISSEFAQ